MKRILEKPVWRVALCALAAAVLLWGLCRYAATPRAGVEEEPSERAEEGKGAEQASQTWELIPLEVDIVSGQYDQQLFAFSLEDYIASYNGLYWQDHGEAFLSPAEEWVNLASPESEGYRPGRILEFSLADIWFLPTISVYVPEDQPGTVRKISVDLDEHSDTEEKHSLFREMSLYTLRLFFPGMEPEKLEALYETLDRQAYEMRSPVWYSDRIVPSVLYHQGEVGVFPFFAVGDYERITVVPVTPDYLAELAAAGTELVDLGIWEP